MKKLIISLALSAIAFNANADCYSEGVRVGDLQKFSVKGVLNKSWEGEMVQEGIRGKGAGSNRNLTNIWKFSVTDPAIAKKIDEAMFEGTPIALKYCQKYIKGFATDTDYIITDAKARK